MCPLWIMPAARRPPPDTQRLAPPPSAPEYYLPLLLLNPHHQRVFGSWLAHTNVLADGTTLPAGRLWSPLIQTLFRPRRDLSDRVDAFAAQVSLLPSATQSASPSLPLAPRRALSLHLRCMETLTGYCGTRTIIAHAECAKRRLALRAQVGAGEGVATAPPPTVFVATMHARDRKKLEQQLLLPYSDGNASSAALGGGEGRAGAAPSVRVVYASNASDMAERVETGVRRQEDGRILDTWLLARGAEVLLSPASTMSYLALGLAPPDAQPITLKNCAPPPSTEPPFHLLRASLQGSSVCRAMAAVVESGHTADGQPAQGLSQRLREVWNASRAHW